MSKRKQIPPFKSEEDERTFWECNDSTEYIDWSAAKQIVIPNLKPSEDNPTQRPVKTSR
jgi:hypothetical protein